MKKLFFFTILLFCLFSCLGQHENNVKRIVNELTLPKFYGRGASERGEIKAANYIKNEFKQLGLKSISKNFFQHFNYSTNIFPSILKVSVDGVNLIPGIDFTLANNSKSINDEFSLCYISNDDIINKEPIKALSAKNLKKTILVLDGDFITENSIKLNISLSLLNNLYTAGIIKLRNQKPKYFGVLNRNLSSKVNITALKSSFPKNAKSISINYESVYIENNPSMNIIGLMEGVSVPDSFIVICGHYDHLGMLGNKTFFPGADDNASAIGVMIELAKFYIDKNKTSKYSLVFIAFGGEESGLCGSKYFVKNPLIPLGKIKIVLNIDMVGFGKDGLNIWNSNIYPDVCEKFDSLNYKGKYFTSITYKGITPESDHHPFYLSGVKAIFITSGIEQSPYYHTVEDTYSHVPFDKIDDLIKLITDFIP